AAIPTAVPNRSAGSRGPSPPSPPPVAASTSVGSADGALLPDSKLAGSPEAVDPVPWLPEENPAAAGARCADPAVTPAPAGAVEFTPAASVQPSVPSLSSRRCWMALRAPL